MFSENDASLQSESFLHDLMFWLMIAPVRDLRALPLQGLSCWRYEPFRGGPRTSIP